MKRRGFFSRMVAGVVGFWAAKTALKAQAAPPEGDIWVYNPTDKPQPVEFTVGDVAPKGEVDSASTGLLWLPPNVIPDDDAPENSAVFMFEFESPAHDDTAWVKIEPMCAPFPEGWITLAGEGATSHEPPRVSVTCEYCDGSYFYPDRPTCPGCGAPPSRLT